MKYSNLICISAFLFLLASCSSSKKTSDTQALKIPVPSEEILSVAKQKFPGINLEALSEGHKIYTNECTNCHGAKAVKSEPESEWVSIIDRMAPKANLSEKQKKQVLEYVLSARAFVSK